MAPSLPLYSVGKSTKGRLYLKALDYTENLTGLGKAPTDDIF